MRLKVKWRRNVLDDVHLAVSFVERDATIFESKEGVIATHTDALAGMELGAALADDDVTCDHALTAEQLYAEPLAVALATVH